MRSIFLFWRGKANSFLCYVMDVTVLTKERISQDPRRTAIGVSYSICKDCQLADTLFLLENLFVVFWKPYIGHKVERRNCVVFSSNYKSERWSGLHGITVHEIRVLNWRISTIVHLGPFWHVDIQTWTICRITCCGAPINEVPVSDMTCHGLCFVVIENWSSTRTLKLIYSSRFESNPVISNCQYPGRDKFCQSTRGPQFSSS